MVAVKARSADVASVLDEARGQIADLEARGYQPDELFVTADVYREILDAKRDEARNCRGVFLLGLELRMGDGGIDA